MKLNAKVTGFLVTSFVVVSVPLAYVSVKALAGSQEDNLKTFKEELLELGQEFFENDTISFFSYLDYRLGSQADGSVQDSSALLKQIMALDPKLKSSVVFSISDRRLLGDYSNPEIARIVDQGEIEKMVLENTLNRRKIFDFDNSTVFLADAADKITPQKVQFRVYEDYGLIVGFGRVFTTEKVRFDFIQRKNTAIFRSYLTLLMSFIALTLVLAVVLVLYSMRKIVIRPLKVITEGIKHVKEGLLGTKIKHEGGDEFGEIASAFNSMTDELEKSRIQLKGYSQNLEREVQAKTDELQKSLASLKKTNDLLVGRELKMIELKKQIRAMQGESAPGEDKPKAG